MFCNTIGNPCSRARRAAALIGLLAGGYVAMSAAIAGSAAAQGSNEAISGGWFTQIWPSKLRNEPAKTQDAPQYVGASSKEKSTDEPTEATPTKRKGDRE